MMMISGFRALPPLSPLPSNGRMYSYSSLRWQKNFHVIDVRQWQYFKAVRLQLLQNNSFFNIHHFIFGEIQGVPFSVLKAPTGQVINRQIQPHISTSNVVLWWRLMVVRTKFSIVFCYFILGAIWLRYLESWLSKCHNMSSAGSCEMGW